MNQAVAGGLGACDASSPLKNAVVAFSTLAKCESESRTARKSRHWLCLIWNPIVGFSQPVEQNIRLLALFATGSCVSPEMLSAD